MADYEPPSFSLGLDLDFDLEPQRAVSDPPIHNPVPDSSFTATTRIPIDDEGLVGAVVADSDEEIGADPPRILKRLRKGPHVGSLSAKRREYQVPFCSIDDEIEEFLSEDSLEAEDNVHPSAQFHSVCSSSKIPLNGFLTNPSSSQPDTRKRKHVLDAAASTNLETRHKESIFPNLTISPLRKFQLVESDSDDPSSSRNVRKKGYETNPYSKEQQSKPDHSAATSERKKKLAASVTENEDLWKDFCPMKKFNIPTPALDEFCEEYFQSVKETKQGKKFGDDIAASTGGHGENKNRCLNDRLLWDSANTPPAYRYFFHEDSRIQKLVRDCLPNFSPLGVTNSREYQQPSTSVIDYMRQFSNGEASISRAHTKISVGKSSNMSTKSKSEEILHASEGWLDPKSISNGKPSKRQARQKTNIVKKGRNNSRKSHSEEVLKDPGSWMDPKSCFSTPKDASKRRVLASGESGGHWFTSSDGKKVYVNKSGQELTGRTAYRHYKKEKGGFRKSKKKGSTKKGK